ncbi:hypothetical protein [Rhizohabitans arisaemae]|uniref:hypothetical protein n=1 Tax=Rhizohabitans arisaemae TaxID=2720610 RepID=UPI0024B0E8CC|nr:hypothetical protein [Rhizohabitans arisaemae]
MRRYPPPAVPAVPRKAMTFPAGNERIDGFTVVIRRIVHSRVLLWRSAHAAEVPMRRLLAALTLVALVAACTSGPTLDEAAAELQKDLRRFETDDVFKNELAAFKVVEQPDRDIPCGDGRFKRVFAATAEDGGTPLTPNDLYGAQRIMESTLALFGYEVTYDMNQLERLDGRDIRADKKELGITVNVAVRPGSPAYRLRAETLCLQH